MMMPPGAAGPAPAPAPMGPDTGYSGVANQASEALAAKNQGGEDAGAPGGPVLKALETLAMFIQAKEEEQHPRAAAMKQALLGLMGSLKSEGPEPGPDMAPPPPQEGMAPPAGPMSPGEEMASRKPTAKVL